MWRGHGRASPAGMGPHSPPATLSLPEGTAAKGPRGGRASVTHLQVAVDHAHLMAVQRGLQDLLNAMTACKHQGQC